MKPKGVQSLFKFLKILLVWVLFLSTSNLEIFSQESSAKQKARISLEYSITNNENRQLIATVKTKIGKSYQLVPNVEVNFYYAEMVENNFIGTQLSNDMGMSILDLPKTIAYKNDSINKFDFIATIEENPTFRNVSKEIEIYESKLELNVKEKDSLRNIIVYFTALDSMGNYIPKEDLNVKLYVKRMFGDLLVSDEYDATDKNGTLSFNFPGNIPGDEKGMLTVKAKIDDDENFGTVLVEKDMEWGTVLKFNNEANQRELWTARANTPILLLILINGMIIATWGVIIYIILQVFRIRKIGKIQEDKQSII